MLSGAKKSFRLHCVASSGHISQQMHVRCKMDYQMSYQDISPLRAVPLVSSQYLQMVAAPGPLV